MRAKSNIFRIFVSLLSRPFTALLSIGFFPGEETSCRDISWSMALSARNGCFTPIYLPMGRITHGSVWSETDISEF